MTPKQECGPEFCGACEVPAVCGNPIILMTARAAINAIIKGHEDVRQQLDESGFNNEQIVAIVCCVGRRQQDQRQD